MNKQSLESMTVVHPNAAGLDIGAREIWAAVRPDLPGETVRRCATFTPDLVNGTHIKRVPGRKSDVLDCQWLRKLHSLGLLHPSFRPDAEMRALRALLRHRAQLIQHRAPYILHMQKALTQMNLQLHHVLSDITGQTGMKIIRAIVAGERNPQVLAAFRHPSCKSSEETIVKALTGHWQEEHLFVLRQSLELYDFYTAQLQAAAAVTRAGCAFGAFYRRKRATLGPMQALMATAHRIARTVYFMHKNKIPYRDIGTQGYEEQRRARELRRLKRQAAKLGFELHAKAA